MGDVTHRANTRLGISRTIWAIVFLHVCAAASAADSRTRLIERAEAVLPNAAARLALNESVNAHWAADGNSLWYRRETPSGDRFVRVSLPTGTHSPLFDHGRLAAALEKALGRRVGTSVPEWDEDSVDLERRWIEISVDDERFRCNWGRYACRALDVGVLPPEASRSPDGRFDLVRDGYNLKLVDRIINSTANLTSDGTADRYYGADVFLERDHGLGLAQKPAVVWSHDSRFAATIRLNVADVGRTSMLRAGANTLDPRPRAVSFRFPMLGDEKLPTAELVIVDARNASVRVVDSEPWPMPSGAPFGDEPNSSLGWWSRDSAEFSWLQIGRGNHRVSLWTAGPESGESRQVLEETSLTRVGPQQGFIDPRISRTLPESDEVIWFSERDGWGHLYLHDAVTGSLKRRLTQGRWLVRELVHVDAGERTFFFTAGGREDGRNPYFRHLYRASLDGGDPELLTPEDADHSIVFSPDGRYFVDTFSRVDTAPKMVVRTNRGEQISVLDVASLDALIDAGWRFPEPFVSVAADGETQIFGAIYYPFDFDSDLRYAVINDVYPLTRAPSRFRLDTAQSLANLGFIVVTLDARGATGRSRAFHDAGYGLMAGRLDDHVAVLRALGADRPYVDLDRVGVIGHSWGGAAAARAVLTYPEFFQVAVASAGTHDLRIAQGWFAESVVGLSDPGSDQATNMSLAERLEGKLLLAHGGADYWTHAAHTLRLAQSLVDAGKDFDLILLPDREHNVPSSPHFRRRSWEYFLDHLGPPIRP